MRRTETSATQQLSISLPDAVTFDFSRAPLLKVTIPATSTWSFKSHWHHKVVDVSRGLCVQGRIQLSTQDFQNDRSVVKSCGRGSKFVFETGQFIYLGSSNMKQDAVMEVVANETLHRNICSAILDADIYPELDTTPLPIKLLFSLPSSTTSTLKTSNYR
ncbi:hypothetical protein Slin14017_G000330 [Septoria linicola]|nr:hypothetical protein Slin14017_G000330 [Septoria linicola]